ncbi:MAG: hypothetical protein NTV52_01270 [Acidobacteria bacterium]|nr:hypothetical protein [Acidobacteriota bacterium]
MRSQQKAIFDSIASGALNAQVPYLSKAELMYIASEANKILRGDVTRFTRNALEGWFRAGILPEPTRTDRNRLFSIIDAFRAAVVLHLSAWGIPLEVCREAVVVLDDKWVEENLERSARFLEKGSLREFEGHDFVVISVHGGNWHIGCDFSLEELALETKISAGVHLLNAVGLLGITAPLGREVWEEKAKKLVSKLDAEIAKAKQKEAK